MTTALVARTSLAAGFNAAVAAHNVAVAAFQFHDRAMVSRVVAAKSPGLARAARKARVVALTHWTANDVARAKALNDAATALMHKSHRLARAGVVPSPWSVPFADKPQFVTSQAVVMLMKAFHQ
jgi:hypothetical protein